MKHILLIVSLFSSLVFLKAQETPEYLINNFFLYISGAKYEEALLNLPLSNKLKEDTVLLSKLQVKLESSTTKFGKYFNYEVIDVDEITPSFIMYSILIKYAEAPERMNLTFYKPYDIWQVNSIRINSMNNRKATSRQRFAPK